MTDSSEMRGGIVRRIDAAGGRPSASGEGRIGPLMALPRMLQEFGVEPRSVLHEACLSPRLFNSADNTVSQEAICRLLSVCAARTGRADFGLQVGARFSLPNFGLLGEIMRNSATAAEAIRMLILHLHFYDRLAVPLLYTASPANVFLGYVPQHPAMDGISHLLDAAIAVAYRTMRELCGPAWQVQDVQFSHRRPASAESYRRLFGQGVHFDAEMSGLVFASSWLDQRVVGANPALFRELTEALVVSESGWPISLAEQAQCIMLRLLHGGAVSSAGVAQLFGISERTLRDRLRAEGTSMQQLLAATRFELARHLLEDTELPLSRIAGALCYADPAVFSRAFHGWAGVSPRQWRSVNRKR
ncbi:MAG: AraC family transcriptional regulator [Halieaceae bacterium]|nr:AraC family transcriptional regulator [Halieaceae bacterium]MCP5165889.1 AraC family transcriptional regulator [Pseudomonadales bacterium]MCP5195119.1 AraC family transcriptional regulator [Pseudomonadales bacterium]